MLNGVKYQSSRFELKFLISESTARTVRDFVASYLVADEYSIGGRSYSVHSLYFDAPDMMLYSDTIQGKKNRFKLRARFYDQQPDSPVFLEIKRRTTDAIIKHRAAITRQGYDALLMGGRPQERQLLLENTKSLDAMHRFCYLCGKLGAVPRTYVSYQREAYVSPAGNQFRVTFDRKVHGAPFCAADSMRLPDGGTPASIDGVVLELKFTQRFPSWMGDLVRIFNLQRCSVPKYVKCSDAIGVHSGQNKYQRSLGPQPA